MTKSPASVAMTGYVHFGVAAPLDWGLECEGRIPVGSEEWVVEDVDGVVVVRKVDCR